MTKTEIERMGNQNKNPRRKNGETRPKLFFNPSKGEFGIASEGMEIPPLEEQIKGMIVESYK